MIKSALVAGSFDPITRGHVWLIRQGLRLCKDLVVVVGNNPKKKYLFTQRERENLALETLRAELTADEFSHTVILSLGDELLVNFAKRLNIGLIVRGIRNSTDFAYESEMMMVNRHIEPDVDTVFVVPPKELTEVSSSTVKALIGYTDTHKIIERYITENVLQAMQATISIASPTPNASRMRY